MTEGPAEELNLTENAQPAIMVASIVSLKQLHWAYLRHMHGVSVSSYSYALGHSLGEYTANVLGESISLEDGVRLANIRGKAMQEAVQGLAIRMTAVSASEATVRGVMNDISIDGVCEIAGINHDQQVVLSGTKDSVDTVADYIKTTFKVPCKALNVSAPFHCKLMKRAAEVVRKELENMQVNDSAIPVMSNAHTKGVTEANEIRQSLVDNIASPALFLKGMEHVVEKGASLFSELGPKKLLINIVAKIAKDRNCLLYTSDAADE